MIAVGQSYTLKDNTKIIIGGVTKRYPEIVWSIDGNWYDRFSGRFIYTDRKSCGIFCLLIPTWRDINV